MIYPLSDRLVAEKMSIKTKTASGLYLPVVNQEEPTTAIVCAVGPDVVGINKGDEIVYKAYSATGLAVNGKDYLIIKQEDVLAIVKGDK